VTRVAGGPPNRPRRALKRPGRRFQPEPIDRPRHSTRAIELFNAGRYWDAHEELEVIWRSVPEEDEALVLQGLIQSAAALLHRERNNVHGVQSVGGAALEKLAGRQHPAIEFETVEFRGALETALVRGGPPPTLRLRIS
jgi:hypothetical protein